MKNLEFIPESHTYLYKGKKIPSVSDLINFQFDNPYKDVDKKILQKAANYGTECHEAIEQYIKGEFNLADVDLDRDLDLNIKSAIHQYDLLARKYMIKVNSDDIEVMRHWKGRYAGTFDLKTIDDYIIDIKTTSKLHKDFLAVQLGLYYMMMNIKQEIGYVLWLPKTQSGEFLDIKVWSYEQCIDLVERYEKHNSRQKRMSNDSLKTIITQTSLF